MTSPLFSFIILLISALVITILWLAVTSLPITPGQHGITRRGRSLFLHLALLFFPTILNGFAFLPLFADHQPFPAPFANLQVVAILESLGLIALYTGVLRGLRTIYRHWQITASRQRLLLILLSVFLGITLLPVLLAAIIGST